MKFRRKNRMSKIVKMMLSKKKRSTIRMNKERKIDIKLLIMK